MPPGKGFHDQVRSLFPIVVFLLNGGFFINMAKELPYFNFCPGEWLAGDITLCSSEAQGVFINLCCYYWIKDCSISLANAEQRFNFAQQAFKQLLSKNIFSVDEQGMINIKFLDEQMIKFSDISIKRSEAASKRGKAKAKQKQSKSKAIAHIEDKIREDKIREIYIPTFDEFKNYALENFPEIDILKLELKYKAWVENGWKDGNNKKIVNWKTKILNTIPFLKNDTNSGNNQRSIKRVNDLWK